MSEQQFKFGQNCLAWKCIDLFIVKSIHNSSIDTSSGEASLPKFYLLLLGSASTQIGANLNDSFPFREVACLFYLEYVMYVHNVRWKFL